MNNKLKAVLALVATLSSAAPAMAIGAGEPAPGFTLPGTSGDVSLEQARGKVVYLDFWASWCVPCRKSFPWMAAMQKKYGPQGFTVIAVNVDARSDDAKRFLAETPAEFPLAFDPKGTMPKAYAIKGMPSSVLIGADGKVIETHAGFREEEVDALEKKIRAALPAKP